MTDVLLRALSQGLPYRLVLARTTGVVREAILRHGPGPTGALALARAITSTALAAVADKDGYRLSVQWSGRGDLGSVHADMQMPDALRGYITGAGEGGSIEEGFGSGGLLSVIRQRPSGAFVQGQVPLSRRDVDGDVEDYMERSEQLPSVLRVLVELDGEGYPRDVVGVLAQALPGGRKAELLGLVAPALLDRSLELHADLAELAAAAAPGLGVLEWMGEAPLRFHCGCTPARVEAGVRLLGAEELQDMLDKGEEPEVHCDYCSTLYRVDKSAIERILAELLNEN